MFDGVRAPTQQVVEIEEVPLAFLLLVAFVHGSDLGGGPRRDPAGGDGRGRIIARADQAGLGPLDLARELEHRHPRRGAPTADEGPDDAPLGAEHRRRLAAVLPGVAPQLREGERVEGAGGHRAHPEAVQALRQLAGGLAGERDREDVAGRNPALLDQPRHPSGENPGLARSGRSEDRERRGVVGDRGALRRIEVGEERVGHPMTLPIPDDNNRAGSDLAGTDRVESDRQREEAPSSRPRLRGSELLGAPASRRRVSRCRPLRACTACRLRNRVTGPKACHPPFPSSLLRVPRSVARALRPGRCARRVRQESQYDRAPTRSSGIIAISTLPACALGD